MRLRWLERPEEPVAPPPPAPQRSLEPARGGRPRLVQMGVETRSLAVSTPGADANAQVGAGTWAFCGAAKTKTNDDSIFSTDATTYIACIT